MNGEAGLVVRAVLPKLKCAQGPGHRLSCWPSHWALGPGPCTQGSQGQCSWLVGYMGARGLSAQAGREIGQQTTQTLEKGMIAEGC